MNKLNLLFVPLLLGFLAEFAAAAEADVPITQASNRPNVILLFVDDLGWNDLGYRNSKFETPNIDRLAAESVDFERAYVPNPACSPSRVGLLTGQHPVRHGIVRHIPTSAKFEQDGFDKFGRSDQEWTILDSDPAKFPSRNWLPLESTTYAEALGRLGYVNHFAGKWHLGHEPYHPIQQGFDTQFGTTNFGHPKSYNAPFFVNSDVLSDVNEGHLAGVLTDHCVELIGEHDQSKPFMLSLWYYGVHRPPVGRPDLVAYFKEKGYDKQDAIYAAQVKAIDESVGKIRSALKAKSLDQNTVIVFTSDQGSLYSNAPLRGNKRVDTLCEGGNRVPLFIHHPTLAASQKPATVDTIVSTMDIFPTLVELAGGSISKFTDLDGVSLLPVVEGTSELKRDEPLVGYRAYEDLYASVRRDQWNLLAYRSGEVKLYDVVDDVGEQNDVAAEYPNVVRSLKADLLVWEARMNVTEHSPFSDDSESADGSIPQKHLFGAKLMRRRLVNSNPTQDTLDAFDKLSYQYTADVMKLREAAGIDSGLIKVRDKAYKQLIKTDLDQAGDEFWLKLQEMTGITDKQRVAFRETKYRSNRFKAEAKKLMEGSADKTGNSKSNAKRKKKSKEEPRDAAEGQRHASDQTGDVSNVSFEDLEALKSKAKLIYEDQFDRSETDESEEQLGPGWETNTKTARNPGGEKQADLFDGFLRITKGTRAVHGTSIRHTNPFKDGIVSARFRIYDEKGLGFHFNDPNCEVSSAGHICRVGVAPNALDFRDGKTGQFNMEIRKLKEAGASKDELAARMKGTKKAVPAKIETGRWHELTFLIQGDQIIAWIDGNQVGDFRSPGVDHSVKHNIALAVWGTKADVDDLRIWSLVK